MIKYNRFHHSFQLLHFALFLPNSLYFPLIQDLPMVAPQTFLSSILHTFHLSAVPVSVVQHLESEIIKLDWLKIQ